MRGTVAMVLSLLALCGVCFGAAGYDVGDSAGWTLGVDYKHWASSNSFHVGDTLAFRYNSAMHNVKQVSKEDYESCNANNPIASFSSGFDTITLQEKNKLYFICGIPCHCQDGMKVKIKVSGGKGSPKTPTTPVSDCPPAPNNPPSGPFPPGSPPPPSPYGQRQPDPQPKSDSAAATSVNCFQLCAALILTFIGFRMF